MTIPRPQFSLKAMLWLMACVACFCAGMDLGHHRANDDAKLQALIWLRKTEAETRAESNELRQLGFVELVRQVDAPADSPPPIGPVVLVALLSGIVLIGAALVIRSYRAPS